MATEDPAGLGIASPGLKAGLEKPSEMVKPVEVKTEHPSGKESHGRVVQILRTVAFAIFFLTCCATYVSRQKEERTKLMG